MLWSLFFAKFHFDGYPFPISTHISAGAMHCKRKLYKNDIVFTVTFLTEKSQSQHFSI